MGWSIDVYVISGTIISKNQAEEIYDNYIKFKKKSPSFTRKPHYEEYVNDEFKSIFCHPNRDDEDEEACDFESTDFSISKSLELPIELKLLFPNKVYLVSQHGGGDDKHIWCLYHKIKKYDYTKPLLVEEFSTQREEFQKFLNKLNIQDNRILLLTQLLHPIFITNLSDLISKYYYSENKKSKKTPPSITINKYLYSGQYIVHSAG